MIKKYKGTLLLTSVITISPMFVGMVLWNRLPERIATHFGADNAANGWSSRPFAVFGMPMLLLGLHLLCFFATLNDPKKKNINEKLFRWILWLIPVVSLISCLTCYGAALGMEVNFAVIIQVLVGAVFVVAGNYMHKIKQNYTVGIKLPWTLHSEENWNRTHRVSAWLWILCGILMICNSILKIGWLMLPVLIVLIVFPMVYSFILYKKGI